MNTMVEFPTLIRMLFSPHKLWNAIQVWKMVRLIERSANRFNANNDIPPMSPENLAMIKELVSSFGGPDVEAEGEEQEE